MAVSLSSLPQESLEILDKLRNASNVRHLSDINPASSLKDFVLKRISALSFEAWQNRKQLIGADHPDAFKSLNELAPHDRLFAGLMGISSFQMLREAGLEVCFSLLQFGEQVKINGEIDISALRGDMHSKKLITGVKFKSGKEVRLSPDLISHLRDSHHSIWLANRHLSWLLPDELHQPQRKEHQSVDNLELFDQNQSCMNILSLAITLSRDSKSIDSAQIVRDLLKTAVKGNPFELDANIYNI